MATDEELASLTGLVFVINHESMRHGCEWTIQDDAMLFGSLIHGVKFTEQPRTWRAIKQRVFDLGLKIWDLRCDQTLGATGEMWRQVAGFEDYEVSDLGRVRHGSRLLRPSPRTQNYPCISLVRNGKVHKRYLHTLVLVAFVGPPPSPKHECAHWDGIRTNARLDNLRWALHGDNEKDKVRHGTAHVPAVGGDHHHKAKLSMAIVTEIRKLPYRRGLYKELADRFGVHPGTLSDAYNGRMWVDA